MLLSIKVKNKNNDQYAILKYDLNKKNYCVQEEGSTEGPGKRWTEKLYVVRWTQKEPQVKLWGLGNEKVLKYHELCLSKWALVKQIFQPNYIAPTVLLLGMFDNI